MRFQTVHSDQPVANPLDLVEQLAVANDWAFERRGPEEMALEVPGHWCTYSLFFAWREELGAMHFTSAFDMKVPESRRHDVYELLALVNEQMWIGHFGLWVEEGIPMFRHALLTTEDTMGGHVEDMMEIALGECERFYTAFQFVIWAGKKPSEALEAALFDTVGEA